MTKNEEDYNKKLSEVMVELEAFYLKLIGETTLCKNEALRSLDRFTECGEMMFRINGENCEVDKFLRTLRNILRLKIPALGLRRMFVMPNERIADLL